MDTLEIHTIGYTNFSSVIKNNTQYFMSVSTGLNAPFFEQITYLNTQATYQPLFSRVALF